MVKSEIERILSYDPSTGEFRWKVSGGRRRAGGLAGHIRKEAGGRTEYLTIGINGKNHYAHRLAYLLMTGRHPDGHIDHINGIGSDNRWENLREVAHAENCRNLPVTTRNSSGFLGVTFCKKSGKWRATIGGNSNRVNVGDFDTPEMANEAREDALRRMGYHRNHGRRSARNC